MTNVLIWQLFAPLMPVVVLLLASFVLKRCRCGGTTTARNNTETGTDEPLIPEHDEDKTERGLIEKPKANENRNEQSFAEAVAGLCILGYTGLTVATLKL